MHEVIPKEESEGCDDPMIKSPIKYVPKDGDSRIKEYQTKYGLDKDQVIKGALEGDSMELINNHIMKNQ